MKAAKKKKTTKKAVKAAAAPVVSPKKSPKAKLVKEKKAKEPEVVPLERKKLAGTGPMARFAASMAADKTANFRIVQLTDPDALMNVRAWIPTRSFALDKALKTPGLPCGRVIEVLGDPHVGKSAMLDGFFTSVLDMGGHAICLDLEASREATHGQTRHIMGDASRLHMEELDVHTIEGAFAALHATVRWWVSHEKKLPVLIGIDPIGSLPTESGLAQLAAGAKQQPGDAARAIKQGLRVTTSLLSGSNVCVVVVNHEYENIQKAGGYGPAKKPYGGRGLDFHSSVILKLSRRDPIRDAQSITRGHEVEIEISKMRLSDATGHRFRVAMIKGVGIDNSWTVFEDLKTRGWIQGSGWYTFHPPGLQPARWQGGSFGFARMLTERPELWPVAVDLWHSTTT